jgi:hypothetical protein
METFIGILLKIVSIVMMILFIASVALLILTFRKPKKVSVLSLIITVAISLLTLVIFSALIKYDPPFWLWLLMAVIGIAIGYFWARTTKVFIKGNQVMNRNSIWYLVVWGGIFALNQLITIVTNRPPDIAMALLIISTATVWGTNGNIMRRYFQIRGGLQPQAAGQAVAAPAKPNLAIRMTSAKPTAPTTKAATSKIVAKIKASKPAAPDAGYCHKCGAPLRENASFCMKCGGKL